MSRMLSLSVLVLISASIIGCGKSDDKAEPLEKKIIGKWKINVDQTVELTKTSPKVKSETYESLPEMFKVMAEKMRMEITESEMKMIMGTRSQDIGYSLVSVVRLF